MAIAQPAQIARAARDMAGEYLGTYLGFPGEVRQARAAATSAEQLRDSAESRMHTAVSRAVDVRQKRDAAVQQRDAAFALLAQVQVNQGAGAPAVPAEPRVAPAPVAEPQVQTSAQRLDKLLLDYQAGKAARVEQLALRKTEHDKRLRQIQVDFYRETFQKPINSADLKSKVSAFGAFGAVAAGAVITAVGIPVAICAMAPGAVAGTVAVGSLLGGPAVGTAGFLGGKHNTEQSIEKNRDLGDALDFFDRHIEEGMDPKKAFLEACKYGGINNDDLGIADDIERGTWRHPY